MSTMSGQVEDYLRLRRALGFKLERAGHLLPQLVAYLERAGAATVTSDLAIAWARLPERAQPNHWAQRLAIARGFARYLQALDPATQIPPSGRIPHPPTPPCPLPMVPARRCSPAGECTSAAPTAAGSNL